MRPLLARVFKLFAVAAMVLAMVGLYGVLAGWVEQRRREVGIRMALGAGRFDIGRMILRQGYLTVLSGIALGSSLAFLLTRYLQSFLFEVGPADPVTFLGAATALLISSSTGIAIPFLRALQTDPITCIGRPQ